MQKPKVQVISLRSSDSVAGLFLPLKSHSPERILAGNPAEAAFNAFSNSSNHVIAGLYTCTPGEIVMTEYDVDELCFMLEGVLSIVDSSGHEETFRSGDFFVIPRGFTGIWHVREAMKKYYVIFNPAGHASERLRDKGYGEPAPDGALP